MMNVTIIVMKNDDKSKHDNKTNKQNNDNNDQNNDNDDKDKDNDIDYDEDDGGDTCDEVLMMMVARK